MAWIQIRLQFIRNLFKYLYSSNSKLTIILTIFIALLTCKVNSAPSSDAELDEKAKENHRLDSLNILLFTILLSLTVLTIWSFKHRRIRYLPETTMAVLYGLIVGAIIRYAYREEEISHLIVVPKNMSYFNISEPPDILYLHLPKSVNFSINKYLGYVFKGEIREIETKQIEQKATFDPEIFFNILLPPIIFNAGYALKRKYFFRNLGAIFTYAFIGTTISAFVIGIIVYGAVVLFKSAVPFTFLDTLYFGALISATDPVTILAIFHDLHVDVNMYALVFGESVLNDAVSIILSSSIQTYGEKYAGNNGGFEFSAFSQALGVFAWTFVSSFVIGGAMGCGTAILTKFTHIRDFPLLETALFVLMSYSTFLLAEALDLTGIVAVLFCGICQAHYTYNNFSRDSRLRTKQLFELLNFLAENFIFVYIGVSMFTFPKHNFEPVFIISSFIAIIIGRAANIYPLTWLLNLGRKNKISPGFQHMLFFSGLRGAIAFALAIRNTTSESRQALLTTTSLIVIVTVIVCGGMTSQLLTWFKIPVGVDDETETVQLHLRSVSDYRAGRSSTNGYVQDAGNGILFGDSDRTQEIPITNNLPDTNSAQDPYIEGGTPKPADKALLARWWQNFDQRFMKPFLTHSRPTLLETLPVFCTPLARVLTTTEQLTNERIEPINTLSGDPTFSHLDGQDSRREIGTKCIIPGTYGDSI